MAFENALCAEHVTQVFACELIESHTCRADRNVAPLSGQIRPATITVIRLTNAIDHL